MRENQWILIRDEMCGISKLDGEGVCARLSRAQRDDEAAEKEEGDSEEYTSSQSGKTSEPCRRFIIIGAVREAPEHDINTLRTGSWSPALMNMPGPSIPQEDIFKV